MDVKRMRLPDFAARKRQGEKIVMLTAYDATMARLLDRAGVDALLVGDSLGTVDPRLRDDASGDAGRRGASHASRRRGAERAFVIADMPFLTFQVSVAEAVRNAGRLLQEGGAAAVKLEGGRPVLDVVKRLVDVGIPVMGHLGLQPQSVHQAGGYMQAGDAAGAGRSADDRRARPAGRRRVFAGARVHSRGRRRRRHRALSIPTIGIGAGPDCDGQILVSYDMLGLFDGFVPSFVHQYAKLGDAVVAADAGLRIGRAGGPIPAARQPGSCRSGARTRRMSAEVARDHRARPRVAGRPSSRRSPRGIRADDGGAPRGTCPTDRNGHGRTASIVVVSIFVNPLQFDRKDDLERYPRTLEADLEICNALGVELVFAPSVGEMYPAEPLCTVHRQADHRTALRPVPARPLSTAWRPWWPSCSTSSSRTWRISARRTRSSWPSSAGWSHDLEHAGRDRRGGRRCGSPMGWR